MGAITTMSEKGQVVIPKDVRDALGIAAGQRFDVVTVGGDLLLRPHMPARGRPTHEIMADIKRIAAKYDGRPVSVEDMNKTIAQGWANGFRDPE